MGSRFDLLVVGEVNPDLILTGDVTPAFGQVEKMVDDAVLSIGSSSCIFACAAARLGLKVAFIGVTGDDIFGHFMRDQMATRGIDTQAIRVNDRVHTGLSVILSRPGDRAILTYAGAIPELSWDEIDLQLLLQARHLHLGAFFMLERLQPDVARLFRSAKAAGITTSLDANYDPSERWDSGLKEALMATDIFLPNETELKAITGESEIPAALARLATGKRQVVTKLGAEGGMARTGDQVAVAPALAVPVIDTTGAGDTFDAGYIYGFLHGWSLERSLRLACICGSLSTQASGIAAQPTLSEALAHMDYLPRPDQGR